MSRKVTRRSFLGGSVSSASLLFAERLFGERGPDGTKPSADLEKLGGVAIGEAKKQGATYADLRIGRYRNQFSGYRLSPESGSNITDEVPFVTDQNSFGFGVRVIVNGQWGFAASPLVTAEEIARITREAITVAKANAAAQAKPVQLAPVKVYRDRWASKFDKDPFAIAMDEKLELIHSAATAPRKTPKCSLLSERSAFRRKISTLRRRKGRPSSNTSCACTQFECDGGGFQEWYFAK